MIGIGTRLALAAVLLLVPLTASAASLSIVGVSSSGASTSLLEIGDTVTFDLVLENNAADDIFGIGLGVFGHDSDNNGIADNGLAFVSGDVSARALDVVPGFGGIPNVRHPDNGGTGAVQFGFNNPFNILLGLPPIEPLRVSLFDGVSLSPTNGTGALDTGVDGNPVGTGLTDVHFRVTFQAIAGLATLEQRTLTFGDNLDRGIAVIGTNGAVLPFTNDSYTLTIVPEPGTALLMALGLAGLASRRRG